MEQLQTLVKQIQFTSHFNQWRIMTLNFRLWLVALSGEISALSARCCYPVFHIYLSNILTLANTLERISCQNQDNIWSVCLRQMQSKL